MNWKTTTLGDVLTLKRGYDLPNDSRVEGDVPVVSSSGVTGNHNEPKVKGPAVVTGRYGTLGEVYYVDQDCWPLNTSLYVKDFKGNRPKYIYYFLQNLLKGMQSDKAAVPGVNRNDLHARKVTYTDDEITQKNIEDFIGRYDDLIDNNKRCSILLEDAIRLLYREWFLYFRFPGHESVGITNGIPDGWEPAYASEIIDINPGTPIEKGKEISYIPMSALSESGMTADTRYFEKRTKHTNVKFKNDDVLLARITPCLENGKTGYVYFLNDGEAACGSTEFIVLRGNRVSPAFTYCLARSYSFREHAIKSMTGSSGRQRVQTDCFKKFLIALPPQHLLEQFDETANSCIKQIGILTEQNTKLRQARDLLLPRLMNGDITV